MDIMLSDSPRLVVCQADNAQDATLALEQKRYPAASSIESPIRLLDVEVVA